MENKAIITTPIEMATQEAFASVENPTISWMKFVFTDDSPNGNKKGVKQDQFDSIIRTGLLMPLKSAEGGIQPGHELSMPLGVISGLDRADHQVIGKAALWSEERTDDVKAIKEAFAAGEKLDISWELYYTDSSIDEDGVEWLINPIVRAATLVGSPAYRGRTPVLEVASVKGAEESTIEPDNSVEETQVDELEQVKSDLAIASARIAELEAQGATRDEELASLREFKASVESAQAEASLLKSRVDHLAQNGIVFSAEDVEARKGMWLKMDDEAFSFLVSELKTLKPATASLETEVIPAPIAEIKTVSRTELLEAFRKANK